MFVINVVGLQVSFAGNYFWEGKDLILRTVNCLITECWDKINSLFKPVQLLYRSADGKYVFLVITCYRTHDGTEIARDTATFSHVSCRHRGVLFCLMVLVARVTASGHHQRVSFTWFKQVGSNGRVKMQINGSQCTKLEIRLRCKRFMFPHVVVDMQGKLKYKLHSSQWKFTFLEGGGDFIFFTSL